MLFPQLQVLSRSRTALGGFRGTGWTMTPGPGYTVLQHILYCVVLGIVQKGNMLIRWLISCSSSITAIVLVCSVRSGINHMVKNYLFCQSWPTKHCSLEPFQSEHDGFLPETDLSMALPKC